MKRLLAILFCVLMLGSILELPVSAFEYYVSHYEEGIYAGGTVDLYAYPSVGNPEDYTYQWQFDAGFGDCHSWYDVPDNDKYSGGNTNHLQIHTSIGVYDGWDAIPFQCVVTSSDGTVRKSNNIYIEIYPTEKLFPVMQKWGYGLYAPHVTNTIDLYTADEVNYTASTYAGTKLQMWCGNKSIDEKPVLRKSEVAFKTEIHITENGHTTVTTNNTSYIPYTVGQLKVEFKQKVTIGEFDLGYFDTKTVNVTVSQPSTRMTAQAKSDCSLLRYTYNESQKLASIPKGTTLNIVGEDGSYYQVYHDGYVGYVGKSLVSAVTETTDKLIKEVEVTIPRPVAGESPSDTCNVETDDCTLYHTDPVTWTDEAGNFVKPTDKFQEGKRYTVSIWLSAKSGYQFPIDASGNPKLAGTINGNLPPYINKAYEQDPKEVIELVYTFNSTQAAPETPETVVITPPSETPELPAHTHTPSDWRSTGAYHYKACTSCGDFLTAEDHLGGAATCAEEGTCTVCGYAYIGSHENHTPDTTKWTACGNLYHAHLCKFCGAHCDAQDHTPGPEATETTPQQCTVCGYVIAQAVNHTHSLKKVEANTPTCTRIGNSACYVCVDCEQLFADSNGNTPLTDSILLPATGHTVANGFDYDEQSHWQVCLTCGEDLSDTKAPHEIVQGKCKLCGYVPDAADSSRAEENAAADTTTAAAPKIQTETSQLTESTQATEPTIAESNVDAAYTSEPTTESTTEPAGEPTTEPATKPTTEPTTQIDTFPKTIPWWVLVLVGFGAAGIGVGVTVILMKKK
ncbi:MAG: SH3 domain-containing protein [Lachnospiraceae bacterium]|nr:SH3 domain-containing protein [Lachnospiraceae bacterium]